MAFESVKKFLPVWNPRYTGTDKDDNIKDLKVTDKSFIEGYLMESLHEQGKEKNTTIHKVKVTKVGDKAHITGDKIPGKEDMCSVFGTMVLNDLIASNVQPGAMMRIEWLGKKKPQGGGKPYVIWDVAVDADIEPIPVTASVQFTANTPPAAAVATEATPETVAVEEADDDLPF
jgi:hypothetical protein